MARKVAKDRLTLAQEAARSGIWDLELRSGRLVWTPQLVQLFGLDPEDGVRPTLELWHSLIHPDDLKHAERAMESAIDACARLAIEYRIVRPSSGEVRWIQVDGNTLCGEDGHPVRVLGICVDVTERRELEQRVTQASAESRAKSAFLATMSHELRTPLNAVIGFSAVLLDGLAGPLSDEQRTQVGLISESARHLFEIVEDILDMAKLEAGRLVIAAERFEIEPVVRAELRQFEPQAAAKSLRLEAHCEPGLEMQADARRVAQVLRNLLSNALKFTDAGSVTIRTTRAPGGMAVVEVRDTGIGIAKRELPLLFNPYQRAEDPLVARRSGTGLGLSISRGLVEAMDGQIGVQSEQDKGSRFWFTLPAA